MTYAAGGVVQATDYNTLATTIRNQWGSGTGNHGLGQSVTSISDVGTEVVTATQWSNLIATINSASAHAGIAAITPASVTTGDIITFYDSITTGATVAYNSSGTTGLALTSAAATATSSSATWGTGGNRSLVFTHTVTFLTGDAARYFFNAGGNVSLTFSRAGGSATTRNTEWSALAAACGTIKFGWDNTSKVGGSSTPTTIRNTSNGGYWSGSGSNVVHFKQLDGVATYSTNYIQVEYYWSGTSTNGGSPVLNIKTTWANPWTNAFQDTVTGTTTTSLVVNSPVTTYLTNTWGTPTQSGTVALS